MQGLVLIGMVAFAIFLIFIVPSLIGHGIGKAIGSAARRSRQADTEASLRQAVKHHASDFEPDKRIFAGDGGLAFDSSRKLVFVSSRVKKGREHGKIYPVKDVLKWRGTTWTNDRGFVFHYLDMTVNDIDKPSWRVGFGTDEHLANQAGAIFELLWARK